MGAQLRALVDKLLTNVSQGYVPEGYISESILPQLTVVQKSGKIGKYGLDFLRVQNTVMGGRGGARRIDSLVRSSTLYDVESHGLEDIVTPDDYANVEQPFDAERDSTLALTTALWLGKEKSLADALGDTSVITQNATLSGVNQLDKYTTSKPIEVFNTAMIAVKDGCGVPADTAIMDWSTSRILRSHPQMMDVLGFKFNRDGSLSDEELTRAMGVKRILIANVSFNNSKEGQADALTPVWGKNIIFCVAPPAAQKMQVSLGYRIQMAGRSPRRVYKKPVINPPDANSIICQDDYDQVLTNVKAAYLVKNAVA